MNTKPHQSIMNIFSFFHRKRMPDCKINRAMKITGRCLVLLAACIGYLQSQSQQTKSSLELAEHYFATGEYYTAAHLYEQFLNPPAKQKRSPNFPVSSLGKRKISTTNGLSRIDILFKQAESYRLANYWQKASIGYKECAVKNPAKYAFALYWYAVCERSLGNYSTAEEILKQYQGSKNRNKDYKAAVEKELQTLQYIRQQLARPDSLLTHTRKLNGLNSTENGVFAPILINGNKFLVSSTQTDSAQVKGINPNHTRLFYATLNNGGLEEMAPVTLPVTDRMTHQGAACLSANGNYLYFSQWKRENGRTVSSIYYSVKQAGAWSLPALLPSVNTVGRSSKHPFCTKDGKNLFFASDRRDGFGKFDIWYAPLKPDGTTEEPVNAGSVINTEDDEQAPFYHNSSTTLVFSSNGRPGMGGYDLFAAKGREDAWKLPENLGYPVNSSRDDIYFFARENTGLLSNAVVSSDRGTGCCLEAYSVVKTSRNKQLMGIVRDCRDSTAVADAEVVLKDATGKQLKTITDAGGNYVFDLMGDSYQDMTLTINSELYKDLAYSYKIDSTVESNLLTDVLINTCLCVEKKPIVVQGEKKLVIKAENVVTIYFDFDRSVLSSTSIDGLDSIYNLLVALPAATIQISGYTDGLGSTLYNSRLSDRRARACGDYLIRRGIETGRISYVSFGACCPVEMEIINGLDNTGGRSRNRRAMIHVKKD